VTRTFLLVLAAALVLVPGALAAASLTLSITTASPVTVGAVTLNGVDQTNTFGIVTSVAYTGGQNTAGWNVTAAAAAPASGANALPSLVVTNVAAGACTGGGCTNPTNSVTWPVTITSGGAKIFNAAANTGQGTVSLTSTFQVSYPANVFPGTYSTTVSFTAATGP
jgi:hypothetical protein